MVHTIEDLKSGELIGLKRLKIASGLDVFPEEILTLRDSLEILDLSDNNMSELPEGIAQLKKLRIVFFANNNFKEFPSILKSCPNLSMIGFKSNQIQNIPEDSFPPLLRWLILTDNKIERIPKSIGECHLIQKCMLAGNLIKELPIEMSQCKNLELLRVSANKIESFPEWLFKLPKLSWIAFGGNSTSSHKELNSDLESFDWGDFTVKQQLGEGASGLISRVKWNSKNEEVAVKIFKGEVTSDGLPEDEMNASIAVGEHKNLVQILGEIKNHPDGKKGLVMKLIPSDYSNLGNPPNLETCTRDVFSEGEVFGQEYLLKIAKSIASVCVQLHIRGVNHGDLYAHNIMVNASVDCLLGDFGAASFYDVNSTIASSIERVEVRAFGCLIEDVLELVDKEKVSNTQLDKWKDLIFACTTSDVKKRLSFSDVLEQLLRF